MNSTLSGFVDCAGARFASLDPIPTCEGAVIALSFLNSVDLELDSRALREPFPKVVVRLHRALV